MGSQGNELHIPVLEKEVLHWLNPQPGGIYVDATLGLGGHSSAILREYPNVQKVIGFEWDTQAGAFAEERMAEFGDRFQLIRASYADILSQLAAIGVHQVDGLIADLGVSSLHLDKAERGFTFRGDAPLDMRMNRDIELHAGDLVNRLSEEELADVLYYYGEERQSRRIARFIVEARRRAPVETTGQLAELVKRAIPAKYHPKKIHVATKTFQALRIAVNGEFENISRLVSDAPHVLAVGAGVCIISFHSLEDRLIKKSLAENPAYRVITKKPIQASKGELEENPRARSAKLRVAVRTDKEIIPGVQ